MPLVLEDDVPDLAVELAEALDHLVGLGLHDARVLRALEDEQRRAYLVDVRDRRALAQELLLRVGVADPLRHEAEPLRRNGPRERDQVRRADDVDRRAPSTPAAA